MKLNSKDFKALIVQELISLNTKNINLIISYDGWSNSWLYSIWLTDKFQNNTVVNSYFSIKYYQLL